MDVQQLEICFFFVGIFFEEVDGFVIFEFDRSSGQTRLANFGCQGLTVYQSGEKEINTP